MKITGEIRREGERRGLLEGTYYTDISFSLDDVDERNLSALFHKITYTTYSFGKLNPTDSKGNAHSFSSPGEKNRVKIDYIPKAGRVNVFIKGSEAEEIESRILSLISGEGLENLVD